MVRLMRVAAGSLRAWHHSRFVTGRTRWSHGCAAAIASVMLLVVSLAPLSSSVPEAPTAGSTLLIVAVVAVSTWLYNEYYFPTLVCALLLVESIRTHDLAAERYSTLIPGLLAGGIYLWLSLWYRSVAGESTTNAWPAAAREDAFEVGHRYLAAWAILMFVGFLAAAHAVRGPALLGTQRILEEAGGLVVFIDLIAILPRKVFLLRRAMRAPVGTTISRQAVVPGAPVINVAPAISWSFELLDEDSQAERNILAYRFIPGRAITMRLNRRP